MPTIIIDLVATISDLPIRYFECTNTFCGHIDSTVGKRLGRDHVAWILRQPHPRCTALTRASGAWDANQLGNLAAYTAIAKALEGAP